MAAQQQAAPPPDPQPVDQPIAFGKFDGYTNTVDRERLSPRDLSLALDIDLDDAGQAHRRRGRTKVANGSFHSLFNSNDGTVYGVLDGQLGIIRPNYSFNDLGVTVGGGYSDGLQNVAFLQIEDKIYFSKVDAGSGIITHSTGSVAPWGPAQDFWYSPVVKPTETLAPVAGKLLGAPPLSAYLTYYNGRIYGAQGNKLWATEHLLFSFVSKTKGYFLFEGDITLLGTVSDGLWIGTTEGVWFLGGTSFETFRRVRVMDSPVIPGSGVLIPAELANPPQVGPGVDTPTEVSIAFMTTRGFCVGEDGGKATNLTESKVFFPVGQRATAFFRRQDGMNHYIALLDSQGNPLNGARIGSFVDPEIARGNVFWVDIHDRAKATESLS